MISYDFEPPGVVTSTLAPSDFPIRARAVGEVIDNKPFSISAS